MTLMLSSDMRKSIVTNFVHLGEFERDLIFNFSLFPLEDLDLFHDCLCFWFDLFSDRISLKDSTKTFYHRSDGFFNDMNVELCDGNVGLKEWFHPGFTPAPRPAALGCTWVVLFLLHMFYWAAPLQRIAAEPKFVCSEPRLGDAAANGPSSTRGADVIIAHQRSTSV